MAGLTATSPSAPPAALPAGAVVRPGFHDHHLHVLASAARRASVDVSAAPTLDLLLGQVAQAAATALPGAWLRVWGFDEALAADGRAPAGGDLDRVAPRTPVVLHHRTGHVAVVNRAARAALRERMPGAEIPADGVLTDAHALLAHVGRLAPAVLDAAVGGLSAQLAAAGVTAITDATITNDRQALGRLAALVAGGHLRQRLTAFVGLGAVDELVAEGLGFGADAGGVTIGHVKLAVEAGTELRDLTAQLAGAAARGWPVALHVLGLFEADLAVAAVQAVRPPPGTRHRIEHLALSLDEHVARLARLPVMVVTNPGFLGARAAKYAAQLSDAEQGWLYRVGSLLAAGVPVRAGSDAPVTDPVPLAGALGAIRRGDGRRVFAAAERVGARTALALFAGWTPDDGDVVVLSEDPAADDGAPARARVLATHIGGEQVFAAPTTQGAGP